jgi:DNA polymerase-3 subunit chi
MRVDFYLLSRDPAEKAVAVLAGKVRQAGERLLIVGEGQDRLEALSRALWQADPEPFLANGLAGGLHDARQPILLSQQVDATNGAAFLLLADGRWREPGEGFSRVLYLFDDTGKQAARACWSDLGKRQGLERNFWKQDERGRWVKGP